ncbi:class E sortase [Phytohabitans sp. ZYX-F-186]|uniref:Class E sortase n=1 Tax=Phytohabitans maris TaxID=3071409 RepID=A0ABU0Z7Q2_9ACTN|nr:class E sortase [Phytohabitans sp. ZYX-F-186]MDQ7903023.1 class E sortase [Phytohabitans sp. ZYX-F-186]
MTVTMDQPPAASPPREPAAPVPPPSAPAPSPQPAPAPPPRPGSAPIRLALQVPGIALSILAAVALGFVVHLTLLSQVQYERNQQTAYADFRAELARGTAPVGQTRVEFADGAEEGTERLVEPGSAVAVLRIPAIGLRTVVFEGTSGEVLQQGPGHRRDSVLPGQAGTAVVMGRRASYGGPFRDLDLLLPGDRITVTTGQGEHEYRVLGLRYPGEPAPAPLAEGKGRMTLVTADGDPFVPRDILRVDAELTSPTQLAPARKFTAASLPPAEAALATDPAAWTPLMLWSQGLLLATLAITYLRARWGGWQAWIVGAPVLLAFGLAIADQAARLLPNLL